VYDDFGKLRFALSPMASAALTENSTWNMDNQTLKDFAYIYKYDGRLRCTWKKIPGCDPIYYVYDKADRLILSQDGEQRKTGSWAFNKYDALGRVVITGVHTSGRSHESWINLCKDLVVTESKGGNYGYTWDSLPEIPFTGTLLVNHYDDYEHLLSQDQAFRDRLSYTAEADYGTRYDNSSCASCSAKGLLVGTRARVMDGGGEIVTAIYYDERGRVIQTKSTNLLGGTEAEYTAYDFTGHPTKMKHVHTTSSTTTTELYAYTYDHAGRLLKTTHSLNGGEAVTLSENSYDDLGRLLTSMPTNREAMKMTYRYNVRSWLASITTSSFVFSENLYYNIPFEGGTACYNGNISTSVRENYLGYNYTYDNLSRLTVARNFLAYDNYDAIYYDTYNTSYSYDRNGNIKALSCYDDLSLEKLEISHNGNQMAKIADQLSLYPSSYADYTSGFVSYSHNSANRYTYNSNGSMTHDPDKGADYSYNILGMPSQVSVPAILGTIGYKYSATGERLEASYKWHSGLSLDPLENVSRPTYTATNSSKLRQYVGNKIYENGSLKRILFDNGYIENGIYYFYLRDHLGNNCVVGSNQGAMKQWTHYYPYGKPIASENYNPSAQPYKFGGKEQETMFGLDLYDFHARQMDSRVGSFLTVDPLAEKYYSISPYAYCAGNPIVMTDPDGLAWFYYSVDGKSDPTWNWRDENEYHTGVNDSNGNEVVLKGAEAVVVFNGSRSESLGKGDNLNGEGAKLASVTLYGPDGANDVHTYKGYTMTSNAEKFGAIDEGTYDANYDKIGKSGRLSSNWVLNHRGAVRMIDGQINPNIPSQINANGEGYKTGIFIHSSNRNGFAGGKVSTGCLLIHPDDWKSFNSVMSGVAEFKVQVVRQAWGKVLQISDILPIATIRLIDKYIIKEPYIPFTYNKKD
jgi:RHS repeat-associated protein